MAEVSALRDLEELRGYTQSNPLSVSQQEAIEELSNRQKAASAAGTVSPFQSSFNPFNPNFRATAQNAISNMLGGSQISSNPNYLQGRIANSLSGLVDFIPAVGDAVGVGDTITSYRQGDMLGTGINAAATGIGVLPIVGGPASKAVKAGGNRVRSALNELNLSLPKFTPSPETNAFKSRETATVMSPDDFLNLAEDLPENQVRLDSQEFIKDQIYRGEPLETPYLTFSLDGEGVATVTGHEGRHRARVLREMGVTEMPVRLRSEGTNQIRWSEQDNASNRDRLEVTWPSVLAPEKTNTNSYEIAFPIADPLKVELPPLSNAQRTQLGASTLPSYKKAAGVLGSEGRALDFGAGRGQGAETIGFDTFEPYPREGFSPTYTTASDIPDQSYDRLTSLNVLNVMPRDVRDEAVSNIGRVLAPNGRAVVTTRGRDVLKAKGSLGDEPMSVITTADTYQKGFTQPELREYIQGQLGDEFAVRNLPEKIGQAGVLIERTAGGNRVRSALNELEIFQDVFPKSYKESIITPYTDRNIDPRTFSAGSGVGNSDPRVGQVDRNLATQIDIGDQRIPEVPLVSLNDYEGYPFMTTMSDRTAAGDTIRSINGVPVNVSRRGGQNYMLDPVNPEYVWASDESVVLKPKGDGLSDVSMFKFAQDMKARSGGKDTLFMPWTMAPTGGDFSQVGEVMLSYAKNNMGSDAAKALNNDIAKIIPNWKGLNDPMSIADFYAASGNRRKEVIDLMDKKYVHEGSLTSGQARHAMADEGQSMARDGNLRNIGMVDSDRYPYVGNPHPAYSTAMYGEGLGRIDNSMQVYELMPQAAMLGGLVDVMRPPRANLRALEMKPYGGIITEDVLRGIEARRQ